MKNRKKEKLTISAKISADNDNYSICTRFILDVIQRIYKK